MKKILIAEDEIKVAQSVQKGLESDGYEVTVATTGEDLSSLKPCSSLAQSGKITINCPA